jgi:pectinesterase
VFDNCDIVSRDRGSTSDNGYITAASTLLSNPYGFLFINCRLKKETRELADGTVALGRPWHPTTLWADGTHSANPNAVGCVVFKNCWMDSHIIAKGWERMHGWDKNRNEIWFYPQDARFYEYGNTGTGAIKNDARRELSESNAQKYTIENVFDGWKPQ